AGAGPHRCARPRKRGAHYGHIPLRIGSRRISRCCHGPRGTSADRRLPTERGFLVVGVVHCLFPLPGPGYPTIFGRNCSLSCSIICRTDAVEVRPVIISPAYPSLMARTDTGNPT